jgi:hypothetical protein
MRITKLNSPFGAGSQLASFAFPGESACRYMSTDPSAFVMSLLRWLSSYRLIEFGTKKKSGSYRVSDQKALTGGVPRHGQRYDVLEGLRRNHLPIHLEGAGAASSDALAGSCIDN